MIEYIYKFELWRLIIFSILLIFGGCCLGGLITISTIEKRYMIFSADAEQEPRTSCAGCRHDLGGGRDNCDIDVAYECRDGGGFELWEPKEDNKK